MVRLYKIGDDGLKSETDYIDIAVLSLVKAYLISALVTGGFILGLSIIINIVLSFLGR